MKKTKKYEQIQGYVKKRIQTGKYPVDTYLPSEHDLCDQFDTTRTTVRRALDELLREGFIQKEHGRGSKVLERGKSLGLLTIKGFSGAIDYDVKTVVTEEPKIVDWNPIIPFSLTEEEKKSPCVYFQRVRHINGKPVVLENNWYAKNALKVIGSNEFVEGSFFKTLSQDYFIEIMGAEQELKAKIAGVDVAKKLNIDPGDPILHISVRFRTSRPELNLYGDLYCHTSEYPIRNSYFL